MNHMKAVDYIWSLGWDGCYVCCMTHSTDVRLFPGICSYIGSPCACILWYVQVEVSGVDVIKAEWTVVVMPRQYFSCSAPCRPLWTQQAGGPPTLPFLHWFPRGTSHFGAPVSHISREAFDIPRIPHGASHLVWIIKLPHRHLCLGSHGRGRLYVEKALCPGWVCLAGDTEEEAVVLEVDWNVVRTSGNFSRPC